MVGIATGYATARERPALVNLHTTAGLGNAVGALATARANRVPLVVIVGQQDRRHLAYRPFLAGDLEGLAGDYPVWVHQPVRPQDVPGAVARAWHEATGGRGPALVIVPSDDWAAPADDAAVAAPAALHRATAVAERQLAELAALVARRAVAGAGRRAPTPTDPDTWAALVAAGRAAAAPVWQESFAARAGFPQDHPLFAGHLPAGRARLRAALAGHDVVLAVGAPVFRQYPYEAGAAGRAVDHGRAGHRRRRGRPPQPGAAGRGGRARLPVCAALAERVTGPAGIGAAPSGIAPSGPLRPGTASRCGPPTCWPRWPSASRPTPSWSRRPRRAGPTCTGCCRPGPARVPQRRNGRARASACRPRSGCGWRSPRRPVVAVLGDGSSLYGIQALWSAAHYGCGVLFVVLANGRYAVMDRLAERHGQGKAPWPAFEEVQRARARARAGLPRPAGRHLRGDGRGARRGGADPAGPHRAARAGGRGRPGPTFEP